METQKSKYRLDGEVSDPAGGKRSKQKGKHIKMVSERMGRIENIGDLGQA